MRVVLSKWRQNVARKGNRVLFCGQGRDKEKDSVLIADENFNFIAYGVRAISRHRFYSEFLHICHERSKKKTITIFFPLLFKNGIFHASQGSVDYFGLL